MRKRPRSVPPFRVNAVDCVREQGRLVEQVGVAGRRQREMATCALLPSTVPATRIGGAAGLYLSVAFRSFGIRDYARPWDAVQQGKRVAAGFEAKVPADQIDQVRVLLPVGVPVLFRASRPTSSLGRPADRASTQREGPPRPQRESPCRRRTNRSGRWRPCRGG